MVIFEAARAIINMPDVTPRELQPAVTVMQLFLTSSKPVLRFAAVRSLNKVKHCQALQTCHTVICCLSSTMTRRSSQAK
jgi:coatomer protein complex subunit gamma